MKRFFVIALSLLAAIIANSACSTLPQENTERIELSAIPAVVQKLPPPGNVQDGEIAQAIQQAQRIIRQRLPAGQEGENMFASLMSQANRAHNWMLRTLSSGRANMLGSRALQSIYTILYRLATRGEFFIVIVPMDDCQWLLQLGDIPVTCYPQQLNMY